VDSLALTIPSFVFLLWAFSAWFLGRRLVRALAFQLGFLILMSPLPSFLREIIEAQLQHYSALSALGLFEMTGMPVFYTDLKFELSDISLRVAPECSGIHSSLALFITSLVAGHLFLKSNWKRTMLALAVAPLAVIRNGFRIFTIGELCVHIGPQMIDSKIHHKGGPIFFALSLIPFLILLYLLIRSERPADDRKPILNEA
jgi:exosortase C (VPDSG-CTERM-specific)